jgi:tyrosine-protein kinase Etk/Wzc
MENYNNQQHKQPQYQDEETIDLRKIFNYFVGNIHWFILSVALSLVVAFLFNRYSTKEFSATSTMLLEKDNKNSFLSGGSGNAMDFNMGFGLIPGLNNFENQLYIINSYSQVRRSIEALDFRVSYYGQGRFSTREIYKTSPFEVIFNANANQALNVPFKIKIDSDGVIEINADEQNVPLFNYDLDEITERKAVVKLSKKVNPGQLIKTDWCEFYLKINEKFNPESESNNFFFYFNTPHQLTNSYKSRITIEPLSKGASIVKITLQDQNPLKAIDFLNELTTQFINKNLEKKNEFANNTIRFIESQLDTISKSLNIAENDLQNFRSKNKVMDLSFQAQQVFEQVQKLENQKMELDMQKKYYEYLLSYIVENQDIESILAPSAMGVQDPLLNQLILEINQLSVQKSSLTNIKKGADFGPIQKLDAQIRNAKNNIYENTSSLVKSTEIALQEVRRRIAELVVNVNSLPETERQLFGIKRKFELNDNLYTFLLQRRAEAQISKASNTSDNEIIDSAMLTNNGVPIKPKPLINYMIALLLGIAIPSVVIALREYFNMRIDSPDSVKRITNKPIIGYIPNTGEESGKLIFDNLDSPWAEAFRIVRTKIPFFIKEKKNPVIMVTSSVPGEGKSFIATNLASAYALTGKKCVLVGFDLRRPQIAQQFNIDKNIGITNYLIGEKNLDEIIYSSGNPNLDIIPSGVIPPNPAELIADKHTSEFLELLKVRYDYIILDTAPLSPVSDSHHLSQLSDLVLFVIRDRYTHRQALQNSVEEAKNNRVENLCLLINDIQLKQKRFGSKFGFSYGYRYGYKYGYGYGYGYYSEKKKSKKLFNLFRRK